MQEERVGLPHLLLSITPPPFGLLEAWILDLRERLELSTRGVKARRSAAELPEQVEDRVGFEPTLHSLRDCRLSRSATDPSKEMVLARGIEPLSQPYQGRALPLS